MSEKALVSVVVPCYNGDKVVHRLLDSLLEQTYKNLEIILVNDGSTDNTGDVIESYIPRFEALGMSFSHIEQQNKGLGGAINTGLSHITGEFFIWPDADDMLTPDSVEKKLHILQQNPDIALVTSNAFITKADAPYEPVGKVVSEKRDMNSDNLFEDYLFTKGAVVFCSGSHMMRTKMFEEANNGREIYQARRGQNWQLLLPVLYKYKRRIWFDVPLYYYVNYETSMSRSISSDFTSYLNIGDEHKNLLLNIIGRFLDKSEFDYYKRRLDERYILRASMLYVGRRKLFPFLRNIIKNRKTIGIFDHIRRVLRREVTC